MSPKLHVFNYLLALSASILLVPGCSTSRELPAPPPFLDPNLGMLNPRTLDSFWLTRDGDHYIITSIYQASSSIGGDIPGYEWCVRTRLDDGVLISSTNWPGESRRNPAESEALFYYRATAFTGQDLIATSGRFGVTGNQSDGYTIVKPDGTALERIRTFPPRSLLLHYFDGEEVIGLNFLRWGDPIASHVVVSRPAGVSKEWPTPAETEQMVTNGSVIVAASRAGTIAVDVNGRELWRDAALRLSSRTSKDELRLVGQTAIHAEYFVCGDSQRVCLRRFADGSSSASVAGGPIDNVYSVGNTTVVECSMSVAERERSEPTRTLFVFVNGKLALSQPIAPSLGPAVLRPGERPLIGWLNRVYDVLGKQVYTIQGYPVCYIDPYIISVENNRRICSTFLKLD